MSGLPGWLTRARCVDGPAARARARAARARRRRRAGARAAAAAAAASLLALPLLLAAAIRRYAMRWTGCWLLAAGWRLPATLRRAAGPARQCFD
jgi:hypothetical protein